MIEQQVGVVLNWLNITREEQICHARRLGKEGQTRIPIPVKTDRSKRSHWLFWQESVDGQKIRWNFLRSIFNPTHHVVCLCLDILAVRMAFVRKRCGGKFGWSVLVDSLPKLIFGTSRYVQYSWVPSQLTCCAHRSTPSYSTLGIPYRHITVPPPMMTTTHDSLIIIKGHTIK